MGTFLWPRNCWGAATSTPQMHSGSEASATKSPCDRRLAVVACKLSRSLVCSSVVDFGVVAPKSAHDVMGRRVEQEQFFMTGLQN